MIKTPRGLALPRLIGVIHLPPLAGSPRSIQKGDTPATALQAAGLWAVKEARALEQAGFEGIILENFADTPFYKDRVPAETVASLAVVGAAVRETVKLPVGINILRNDGFSALAVAAVTGAEFIRVNVLNGLVASDQGMIEGSAAELMRERERLNATDIAVFADVHVKHAVPLSSQDIGLAVEETGLRAMADAVIVTGATTGRSVAVEELTRASRSARDHGIPLYIGSGATIDSMQSLLQSANGLIVGSALRRGGMAGAPLDTKRVRDFAKTFHKLTSGRKKSTSRK